METRYTVRQAADMTGIKAYVMRYWEDELELSIQRNELGHRYYTGYDIQLFMSIRELKKRGLQLRAIKNLIPQIAHTVPGSTDSTFQLPVGEIQENVIEDEAVYSVKSPDEDNSPVNPKILEFQSILERLITQEIQSKNEDEERYRSLDLAIRRQQLARREAAATLQEKKSGKNLKIHKNI